MDYGKGAALVTASLSAITAAAVEVPESMVAWVVGLVLSVLVSGLGYLVKRSIDSLTGEIATLNKSVHALQVEVAILKDRQTRRTGTGEHPTAS